MIFARRPRAVSFKAPPREIRSRSQPAPFASESSRRTCSVVRNPGAPGRALRMHMEYTSRMTSGVHWCRMKYCIKFRRRASASAVAPPCAGTQSCLAQLCNRVKEHSNTLAAYCSRDGCGVGDEGRGGRSPPPHSPVPNGSMREQTSLVTSTIRLAVEYMASNCARACSDGGNTRDFPPS